MPFGSERRLRRQSWWVAALAAYGLVVALTPFLHHDLECHWRTPGHCVACIATPLAVGAADVAPDTAPGLVDVGGVGPAATPALETPLRFDAHGRSPPL